MSEAKPLGRLQGSLGEWSHEKAIEAADLTFAQLEDWGIPTKPGNRLERSKEALNRIERFNVQFGHGDRNTERLWAEASRTIFELHFIVQTLRVDGVKIRRRLEEVLSGPLEPSHDDPPRDIQAEFFTAALFQLAGYRIEWGEPDLIISDHRGRLGVAVKRVTSTNDQQYHKRVRKAHRQLKRAGLEGFVVVYADQLLARAVGQHADLGSWLYNKVDEWLESIPLDSPDCTVIGLIGLAFSFEHIPGTPRAMHASLRFAPMFVSTENPGVQSHVIGYAEEMAHNVASGLRKVIAEQQ